ncbi:helix-turn-helix domain-containing protein [Streptomyces telluris]|uniref:XRE family transcriptional regulator n=1 Tax=Streptomyces telluris TaxID=2720021 RepID=A0A9X2LNI1_9ACTN|nr:XRE family transcriptional regulator [Streptomyces telluris]MCQ8774415.1 XRE family transcriptional regulator [Streptomyces telluris]
MTRPGESRPKAIPGHVDAAWVCLVEEMRAMKGRSELSLLELAEATSISKSSWERYLNGKQFPPRQAVEALCSVAGLPSEALLARWEPAEASWSRRRTPEASPGGASTIVAGHGVVSETAASPHSSVGGIRDQHRRASWWLRALAAGSRLLTRRPVITTLAVMALCGAMISAAFLVRLSRSSAMPAPPVCVLDLCEGNDPGPAVCEDARTLVDHVAFDGTRLAIEHSPRCRAAWVRTPRLSAEAHIEIEGPEARTASVTGASTGLGKAGRPVTTPMISAPRPEELRACYYAPEHHPGVECFQKDGGRAP